MGLEIVASLLQAATQGMVIALAAASPASEPCPGGGEEVGGSGATPNDFTRPALPAEAAIAPPSAREMPPRAIVAHT